MKKYALLFIIVAAIFLVASADWAEQAFERLTLEEKVGQLFMIGAVSEPGVALEKNALWGHYFDQEEIENLIKNYCIGGLVFFQGIAEKQANLTNWFQGMSKLPLLICQDCEWGLGMRLRDGLCFPKNLALGTVSDESLIYDLGKEIGRQCQAIGVHVNFAPVVDINSNPKNPIIGERSFGACKEDVARKGALFAGGLRDAGVIACAKHFPGHGDTDVDSHLDLPVITHSIDRLEQEELYPFRALIDSGVGSIMTAHMSVPALDSSGRPASISRSIVTDLLRNELGFKGLIFSDAMSMGGISKLFKPEEAAFKAICAGNDILLCPLEVESSINYIVRAVKSGRIDGEELNAHVLKILKTKEKLGLHKNCLVKTGAIYEQLHSQYAKDLQKRLYECSSAITSSVN
ncbi:hypothetical protein KKA53_03285 [Candidatus Dependentiae bacterium]|nr:hypothetical protein [Candidatus Dependentiae bacterium]